MDVVQSINYRWHVCTEITTTRGSTLLYGDSMHTVQSIWLIKNSRCDRNKLGGLVVRASGLVIQQPGFNTPLECLSYFFYLYFYKCIHVSQTEHNGLELCLSGRKNCFSICPYYTDMVQR